MYFPSFNQLDRFKHFAWAFTPGTLIFHRMLKNLIMNFSVLLSVFSKPHWELKRINFTHP